MPPLYPASVPLPPQVTLLRGTPRPEIFSDGKYLYGAVVSEADKTAVLWRLVAGEIPGQSFLSLACVPPSELVERPVYSVLEEALNTGAWD